MSCSWSWPTRDRSSSPSGADVERQRARRVEAGLDVREVVVAAQEKRRQSDEHYAQCDLSDDEETLDAMAPARDAAAP